MNQRDEQERMYRISLRLTADQLEYIDDLVEMFDSNRGVILRMIVGGYMKKHPNKKMRLDHETISDRDI